MIGVAAHPVEHVVVKEFFELFKTPWEFYRSDGQYDVVICTRGVPPRSQARLTLVYGCEPTEADLRSGVPVKTQRRNRMLVFRGRRIPIYGGCLTFQADFPYLPKDEESGESAAFEVRSGDTRVVRVGFELFGEIRYLLEVGQPPANAGFATVELHIAMLRDLICRSSISLAEIPPVPAGYSFVACLTHDVDHPVLRNHLFDHTMLGFLYRATLGSLINLVRRKTSFKKFWSNWVAAFSLPFMHVGLAKDIWAQFDRYLEIERGLRSTFFVIPYRDNPGHDAQDRRPALRAARYDLSDIEPQLGNILASGSEVALHGINAWLDAAEGRNEMRRVSEVTGSSQMGVRMHWLFFSERSASILDESGFSYDSTLGYNETVGYRAGTTQAFKPLDAASLIELPLHIMDTALFYPRYLALSPSAARELVYRLIENAVQVGGVLTINWHDRSIAPERLWDDFYVQLLDQLRARGAWFATATEAVKWFKKRRSAVFRMSRSEDGTARVTATVDAREQLPGLRLRVYKAFQDPLAGSSPPRQPFEDVPLHGNADVCVAV